MRLDPSSLYPFVIVPLFGGPQYGTFCRLKKADIIRKADIRWEDPAGPIIYQQAVTPIGRGFHAIVYVHDGNLDHLTPDVINDYLHRYFVRCSAHMDATEPVLYTP